MSYFKKTILLFTYIFLNNISFGQDNTIIISDNVIIFQGDTFYNSLDNNGLRKGKWLEFNAVGTVIKRLYSGVGEDGKDTSWSETVKAKDSIINNYFDVTFGQYQLGKKNGKWVSQYGNGNTKEIIFYDNGEVITDFVFYYETGKIKLTAIFNKIKSSYNITHYSREGIIIKTNKYSIKDINKVMVNPCN